MQASIIYLVIFLAVLIVLTKPLGSYLLPLAQGKAPLWLNKVDYFIMRLFKVQPQAGQSWFEYALCLVLFQIVGVVFLYLILRLQYYLPLNPQHLPNIESFLAFNIAISFVTNTNWQAYVGEQSLSYLTQMLGLGVQNFMSASSGMCVAFVLMRALAWHEVKQLGNFFADFIRINLYVLLPLAFIYALFLISQGVIQNFNPHLTVNTLADFSQTIAMGPVASQEAIKLLGSNGGGFFASSSAHPFANPNSWTSFMGALSMLFIASSLTYTFGLMVKDTRQGWSIFSVMAFFFILAVIALAYYESRATPQLRASTTHALYNVDNKSKALDAQLHHKLNEANNKATFNLAYSPVLSTRVNKYNGKYEYKTKFYRLNNWYQNHINKKYPPHYKSSISNKIAYNDKINASVNSSHDAHTNNNVNNINQELKVQKARVAQYKSLVLADRNKFDFRVDSAFRPLLDMNEHLHAHHILDANDITSSMGHAALGAPLIAKQNSDNSTKHLQQESKISDKIATYALPKVSLVKEQKVKLNTWTDGKHWFITPFYTEDKNNKDVIDNSIPYKQAHGRVLPLLTDITSLDDEYGIRTVHYGRDNDGNSLATRLDTIIVSRALLRLGAFSMNLEGKEVRFDLGQNALFTAASAASSSAAHNASLDSMTPLGGMVPMLLIQSGGVVFGGIGSGFYTMISFCILAAFLGGLMVGRTPEYLGKKIGVMHLRLVSLILILPAILVLGSIAISLNYPHILDVLGNPSAHGFSTLVYNFSSVANNSGSSFDALFENTSFFNLLFATIMFLSRFVTIVATLALSGILVEQRLVKVSVGTMQTHGITFTLLLISVIFLMGMFTYMPALVLGPIAEYFMLWG